MTMSMGPATSTATKPHTLVGLVGKARAGKDTIAAHFARLYHATTIALADGVRDAAYALDPIVDGSTTPPMRLREVVGRAGWDTAKRIPEVRRTLQHLGTEAGWRLHGEDLWTQLAEHRMAQLLPGSFVVVSDIRQPHEAAWLRSLGGHLLHVTRPDTDDALDAANAAHTTEQQAWTTQPGAVDAVIVNDGSLDALTRTAAATIERLWAAR